MIIDGKKIRDEILEDLKEEIENFDVKLELTIFVVGNDPVVENFIRYKKKVADFLGIEFVEYRFSEEEENLEEKIIEKIKKTKGHGVIIQLPLPKKINTDRILQTVPVDLDIDVLSGKRQDDKVLAPVTGAVWEILQRNDIDINNKKVLIVGKGRLVGQPTYVFFKNKAEVDIITSQTKNKDKLYKEADVVISGTGIPNLIKPEMIKNNVILIDAGTSTAGKKLVGDIDYECVKKAKLFSRTPGGIGPITIAILYKNLVELYKINQQK